MASLTVWRFQDPEGADRALAKLGDLVGQRLIEIDDAALVSWPQELRKPRVRDLGSLAGPGALWGGFWGMFLGLLFLVPVAGLAFGAAAGAGAGSLATYGIDDGFIRAVRSRVTPGTSALFVLGRGTFIDRVAEALGDSDSELIRSNLTSEQERKLRDTLPGTGTPPGGGQAVAVLTVDDHAIFRSAAREVIESTPGFVNVAEASCGEDALEIVDDLEPQLVLIDVRMPGMDGVETTRRIKDAHPRVVVVLISIEDRANIPEAAETSGAVALVRKQDFGSHMLRGLWVIHGTRA